MKLYIVQYNSTLRRVLAIIDEDVEEEYISKWENACSRMHEKHGPVKSVSLWLDDIFFVLVEAEDKEMAEKLALDWIDPR